MAGIKDNVDLTLDRDFMRNKTSHEILSEVRKEKAREVINELRVNYFQCREVIYAPQELEPNKAPIHVMLKNNGSKIISDDQMNSINVASDGLYFNDWSWSSTTTSSINRYFASIESIIQSNDILETLHSTLPSKFSNEKYKLTYIDNYHSDMPSDDFVDSTSDTRNHVRIAQKRSISDLSKKESRNVILRHIYQEPIKYSEELEDDEPDRELMFSRELEDTSGRDRFFNFSMGIKL